MLGFLKRRKAEKPQSSEAPDSRADELREKLAEARSIVEEREEFEAAETPVDRAEPAPPGPEQRRQDVHAAGREIAARMRDER